METSRDHYPNPLPIFMRNVRGLWWWNTVWRTVPKYPAMVYYCGATLGCELRSGAQEERSGRCTGPLGLANSKLPKFLQRSHQGGAGYEVKATGACSTHRIYFGKLLLTVLQLIHEGIRPMLKHDMRVCHYPSKQTKSSSTRLVGQHKATPGFCTENTLGMIQFPYFEAGSRQDVSSHQYRDTCR